MQGNYTTMVISLVYWQRIVTVMTVSVSCWPERSLTSNATCQALHKFNVVLWSSVFSHKAKKWTHCGQAEILVTQINGIASLETYNIPCGFGMWWQHAFWGHQCSASYRWNAGHNNRMVSHIVETLCHTPEICINPSSSGGTPREYKVRSKNYHTSLGIPTSFVVLPSLQMVCRVNGKPCYIKGELRMELRIYLSTERDFVGSSAPLQHVSWIRG